MIANTQRKLQQIEERTGFTKVKGHTPITRRLNHLEIIESQVGEGGRKQRSDTDVETRDTRSNRSWHQQVTSSVCSSYKEPFYLSYLWLSKSWTRTASTLLPTQKYLSSVRELFILIIQNIPLKTKRFRCFYTAWVLPGGFSDVLKTSDIQTLKTQPITGELRTLKKVRTKNYSSQSSSCQLTGRIFIVQVTQTPGIVAGMDIFLPSEWNVLLKQTSVPGSAWTDGFHGNVLPTWILKDWMPHFSLHNQLWVNFQTIMNHYEHLTIQLHQLLLLLLLSWLFFTVIKAGHFSPL